MLARPDRTHARLTLVPHRGDSAQRWVRQPRSVRRVAWGIAAVLPVLGLLLVAMPWQQSASATGRVVAWAADNRQQVVEAPVPGRIATWHVREGQPVRKGDLLVELQDNDAGRSQRLEAQGRAAGVALTSSSDQVASYRQKLASERAARGLALAELDLSIASLEQRRVGEQAELDTAEIQVGRQRSLLDAGIISERAYELSVLSRDKASAALLARDRQIDASRRARGQRAEVAKGKIASAMAELQAAEGKVAEAEQKQLGIEGDVARQSTQRVRAPVDGVVQAVLGGPGGAQVKPGDPLVTLVPETTDRAVELFVDGNDMPLIQPGEQVRMLFEGWPALQFVGLPGGGTGTFAGRVAWVDPSDNGRGQFRVVVVPDPDAPPWPDAARLRQGVRAKGFVLLGGVSLGYELWRQVNGFPPLPAIEDGSKVSLPTQKKPRAPAGLK